MKTLGFRAALALAVLLAITSIFAGLAPSPAAAQAAAFKRPVRVLFIPVDRRVSPKAHLGLFVLREYSYDAAGKQTITARNTLLAEEDLNTGNATYAQADFQLPAGEYELHLMPDGAQRIVERFIVNNLTNALITLRLDVTPQADPAERAKTMLVRVGPSLAELEASIATLRSQVQALNTQIADLTTALAALKK